MLLKWRVMKGWSDGWRRGESLSWHCEHVQPFTLSVSQYLSKFRLNLILISSSECMFVESGLRHQLTHIYFKHKNFPTTPDRQATTCDCTHMTFGSTGPAHPHLSSKPSFSLCSFSSVLSSPISEDWRSARSIWSVLNGRLLQILSNKVY